MNANVNIGILKYQGMHYLTDDYLSKTVVLLNIFIGTQNKIVEY